MTTEKQFQAGVRKVPQLGVASGITTLEEEFLAHMVLPDGQTVGQWLLPQVAEAYDTRQMPPMLPPA